ncbi:MAG: EF-hand domain-containing protein [Rhodoplanes sp.]|uniref:EF-hand domain-containing protein n=1 Tax=Rhodoplanes sp. TaxID=1968906 RepID=UPI0017CBAB76|nr:EF-hand domain-containing protein [Rhodoplanes sp.]NVO13030.1 EF-hand domain-containing protein [Rhodoplanes sp.]
MSTSAVGSGGAYAYLRSLLQQQQQSSKAGANPIQTLLDAFYPNGKSGAGSSGTSASGTGASGTGTTSGSSSGGVAFSPDMYGAMLSMQSAGSGVDRITARSQSIFSQLDADGDGAVNKSELEAAFGSGADTTKVDGLFSALDADADGSISQAELTSAAQQSHARHRHHRHQDGDGSGGGDPLAQLMAAAQGASSSSATGTDGATSTTITFADGSTVTMNVPASSSTGQSTTGTAASTTNTWNMLEQLIKLQSQMIAQTSGTTAGSGALNRLT